MIQGILLIGLMIIVITASYKFYTKSRVMLSLIMVLLLGLILRLYVASDNYLHPWDERYHALVAKNLAIHPLKPTLYETPLKQYDYKNWLANHVWLEKGPVPLWLIAVSIHYLGEYDIAVRLPSIILALISIYITFCIGSALFNHKIGLLSAFLHSINGLLIEIVGGRVSSDHVELMFTVFIEMGVYISILAIKRKRSIAVRND